jgi:hypothetical protein
MSLKDRTLLTRYDRYRQQKKGEMWRELSAKLHVGAGKSPAGKTNFLANKNRFFKVINTKYIEKLKKIFIIDYIYKFIDFFN